MKNRQALAATLCLLLLPAIALAKADGTKSCPIKPPGKDQEPECQDAEPASFSVRPAAGAPIFTTTLGTPLPVLLDCSSYGGGMICEGWSQEVVEPRQFLTYSWNVRVGFQVTQYETGTFPYVDFSCSTGQRVTVTMTLHNGPNWSGSTQQSYTCGDSNQ